VEKVALVILERINKKLILLLDYFRQKQLFLGEIVLFSQYLDPELVCFINQMDRDKAIQELTDLLVKKGLVKQDSEFYKAVIDREKIVSTGIGMGIAVPHAKLENCSNFFIAIGIQSDKGIEWKALDGSPVKIIFLIGGPANQQKKYLKLLSHLTTLIKNEKIREKLLHYKDPHEIVKIFKAYDN
jgi:nitrogen PTS system EIIA component